MVYWGMNPAQGSRKLIIMVPFPCTLPSPPLTHRLWFNSYILDVVYQTRAGRNRGCALLFGSRLGFINLDVSSGCSQIIRSDLVQFRHCYRICSWRAFRDNKGEILHHCRSGCSEGGKVIYREIRIRWHLQQSFHLMFIWWPFVSNSRSWCCLMNEHFPY